MDRRASKLKLGAGLNERLGPTPLAYRRYAPTSKDEARCRRRRADSMNRIKVGLVGFGTVAQVFHGPLISAEPTMQITHVVERHGDTAQEHYPHVQIVRSLDDLLATEVDLVVILTPNELHKSQACQALEAGKHVVVDKPFTITSVEADEVIKTANRCERVLSVFQNRRWDSDFLTVSKILESGQLGRLVEFESRFDRFRPNLKGGWREEPRPGSGVLYDLGSHLVDQALCLFGLPERLWADIRCQREGARIDDFFEVIAHYPGLRVVLKASCLAAERRVRFHLRGTKGAFLKHELDPQEAALKNGDSPDQEGFGEEGEDSWGCLHSEADGKSRVVRVPTEKGAYEQYYADVSRAIREKKEPAVTARQARNTIRFLELAIQSQAQQRWVDWSD